MGMARGRPQHFASASEGLLARIIRRNSAPTVGVYLREVARASLAASLLHGAVGCARDHSLSHLDGGMPDAIVDADTWVDAAGPPFSAPLCDGDRLLLLAGMDLPSQPDFVGAYGARPFESPMFELMDWLGSACATATDVAACEQALGDSGDVWVSHLRTTDGDDVEVLSTREAVVSFIGGVDTAQKAVLLAWQAGYHIACDDSGRYGVREAEGGYEVLAIRTNDCPIERHHVLLFVGHDGTVEERASALIESTEACIGRRPPGLRPAEPTEGPVTVGEHFARIARLEAAAVTAFEVLAEELEQLGAPAALVRQTRQAAQDEVRHTQLMAELARRFGGYPGEARIEPRPLRSLRELALDNAAEGCVRETFGALVGTYQVEAAEDPAVARTMRVIAEDETRHAELSWAIAAWVEPLLSAEDRAAVDAATRRAVVQLRAEASLPVDSQVASVAGLPHPLAAVTMVDRLSRDLWC
jgi:rubrerythrin